MSSIEQCAEKSRDALLAEVMDRGRSKPAHEWIAAREIERLRAALQSIANYPSLVPSEEHYRQYPDTERFPDFREIARTALNR